MKKRLMISISLVCLLSLAFTACKGKSENVAETNTEQSDPNVKSLVSETNEDNGRGCSVEYNESTGEVQFTQTIVNTDELTISDEDVRQLLTDIFNSDVKEDVIAQQVADELNFIKACTNDDGTLENKDMIIDNLTMIKEQVEAMSPSSGS